ncbi:hypothetical protein HaLaN_02079 [Haematococcus lacustris]|uniref:Uncharacterized protein n=1 Tax=Haematococcus lacustris TaxID=44745 RepID=A0A699YAT9_HAELA|nr:hypothetical protein HaLaN_02079 [Haematococcus lacustris]
MCRRAECSCVLYLCRAGAEAWVVGGVAAEQAARLACRNAKREKLKHTSIAFAAERARRRLSNQASGARCEVPHSSSWRGPYSPPTSASDCRQALFVKAPERRNPGTFNARGEGPGSEAAGRQVGDRRAPSEHKFAAEDRITGSSPSFHVPGAEDKYFEVNIMGQLVKSPAVTEPSAAGLESLCSRPNSPSQSLLPDASSSRAWQTDAGSVRVPAPGPEPGTASSNRGAVECAQFTAGWMSEARATAAALRVPDESLFTNGRFPVATMHYL